MPPLRAETTESPAALASKTTARAERQETLRPTAAMQATPASPAIRSAPEPAHLATAKPARAARTEPNTPIPAALAFEPSTEREPAAAPTSISAPQMPSDRPARATRNVLEALHVAMEWVNAPAASAPALAVVEAGDVPSPPTPSARSSHPAFEPRASSTAAPPAVVEPRQSTLEIGTIDVHVHPPASAPVRAPRPGQKPVAHGRLSRGFSTGLGLRQS
jgi:hypothetical protein